ncbi:MAG: hypothetical protein ABR976_08585 [Terracidiphilus sp.]|jgi:hypothetical protein
MMSSLIHTRPVALGVFVLTLLTPFACKIAWGQSGAGISGPLTMLAEYNARAPRTCSSVKSPPSAAQAAVLVQCTMDAVSYTGLGLIQDVKLEMGSPRAFVYYTDAGLAGIDLNAKVYELRGSYTGYFCNLVSASLNGPGKNCTRSAVPAAQGWCWKTSFGDWKCKMQGGAPDMVDKQPAPKTF